MFQLGEVGRDRVVVAFGGSAAGAEPLTWGQKAILQDMRDSGGQFSMSGMIRLAADSTVADATARVAGLMSRHAALRMRLGTNDAGHVCQSVAASGVADLDIVTLADDADPAWYVERLLEEWPLVRFDFYRDWPLRAVVVRHRGACRNLVWVLSHLAADGGAHLLLLDDLLTPGSRPLDVLDVARGEQTAQSRQLSERAMRHWESSLREIPALTFGPPAELGPRYAHARFSSPAAHLAALTIARRTRTDASRVALALIAIAIGRATGVCPLAVKVMANNRFRPGLAEVIAPIAQNSLVTIDVTDTTVDEVVARARGASLSAGMRAYYDPDDLSTLMARLDASRGYPARVTCRVNDQRAMTMRAGAGGSGDGSAEVTPDQVKGRLAETSLTWLGRREHMQEQVLILIENQPGVLSLRMLWDSASLTESQVEALLRGVEEVAVEAAFNPAAPTQC